MIVLCSITSCVMSITSNGVSFVPWMDLSTDDLMVAVVFVEAMMERLVGVWS